MQALAQGAALGGRGKVGEREQVRVEVVYVGWVGGGDEDGGLRGLRGWSSCLGSRDRLVYVRLRCTRHGGRGTVGSAI